MHTDLHRGRTLWKCLFLSGKPGLSWSVPCCQTIRTDWQPERRETWSASETKQPSQSETWHRDELVSVYLPLLKHQSVYNIQCHWKSSYIVLQGLLFHPGGKGFKLFLQRFPLLLGHVAFIEFHTFLRHILEAFTIKLRQSLDAVLVHWLSQVDDLMSFLKKPLHEWRRLSLNQKDYMLIWKWGIFTSSSILSKNT